MLHSTCKNHKTFTHKKTRPCRPGRTPVHLNPLGHTSDLHPEASTAHPDHKHNITYLPPSTVRSEHAPYLQCDVSGIELTLCGCGWVSKVSMNINVWLPVSHFVMQVWETQGGRGWERERRNCPHIKLRVTLSGIKGYPWISRPSYRQINRTLRVNKTAGRGGKKKALLMQAHAQLGNRSSGPERVNTDLTGYRCSTSNPTDAHPAVRPQHWSRRPHVSHTLTHSLTLVKWTIFKVSEIDWMFFSRTAAANRLIMITWSPLLLPAHDADMNMIIKPHVQGPDECCLMGNTVCERPYNKNHKCVSLLRVRTWTWTWTETSYITFMFSLVFVMAFLWLSVKLIFIPYKT